MPNTTTKEVPHGIENVDKIWVHDGFARTKNSSMFVGVITSDMSATTGDVRFQLGVNALNLFVRIRWDMDYIFTTFRYTKTTD